MKKIIILVLSATFFTVANGLLATSIKFSNSKGPGRLSQNAQRKMNTLYRPSKPIKWKYWTGIILNLLGYFSLPYTILVPSE